MKPRKKVVPPAGSLVRIPLGASENAFARVLAQSQIAAYDYRDTGDQEPVDVAAVISAPVLFKITVMKSAFDSGRWPVVDQQALEPELASPVEYYMKDKLNGKFSVYRGSDGNTRPSTFEECEHLEAAAVWDPEHVEDRLRDHFAGRENRWVAQLRPSR